MGKEKKEETAVATVGAETAVAIKPDEETLKALREGSGEAADYPFIPLITVDNSKVEETLTGGRKAEVLCPPRYNRIDRVDGEFVNTPIEFFNGIILVVKWEVFNRGAWDQVSKSYISNGAPKFRSKLFSPSVLFGKQAFEILVEDDKGGTVETLTYPELKAKYSKEDGGKKKNLFKLQCTMFVKLGEELVRARFKGASRSAVFDYTKLFKGKDSISAHSTLFKAITNNDYALPFNQSVLEVDDSSLFETDWSKVVAMQRELNKLTGDNNEVVKEEETEEEMDIRVENIGF